MNRRYVFSLLGGLFVVAPAFAQTNALDEFNRRKIGVFQNAIKSIPSAYALGKNKWQKDLDATFADIKKNIGKPGYSEQLAVLSAYADSWTARIGREQYLETSAKTTGFRGESGWPEIFVMARQAMNQLRREISLPPFPESKPAHPQPARHATPR